MKKILNILPLTVWFAFVLAAGCGTLVGNPEDDEDGKSVPEESQVGNNQAASLTFNIADAPIDDVQSVFITITGVEIKPESGDWISIPLVVQQEIDLLQYQDGASLKFAETGPIAAGLYSETRLILSDSVSTRIVLLDGKTYDLKVPGGEESGLKLKTPFTAEAGKGVDLTLDFDLRRSLRVAGQGENKKYMLQPVLRLLKHGEYGHIEGDETAGHIVCVYPEGVQPDSSDACENALNSAIVKNGKYKLPHLPKGKYKIQVFDKDGKAIDGKQSDADVTPAKYKELEGDEDKDLDEDDDDDDKEGGKDKGKDGDGESKGKKDDD
jgi:hypothetical protein